MISTVSITFVLRHYNHLGIMNDARRATNSKTETRTKTTTMNTRQLWTYWGSGLKIRCKVEAMQRVMSLHVFHNEASSHFLPSPASQTPSFSCKKLLSFDSKVVFEYPQALATNDMRLNSSRIAPPLLSPLLKSRTKPASIGW